jgi:hypothetical protein
MSKKKELYEVKLEAMVPAIITYVILAETPEEAIKLIKKHSPNNISYKLNNKKDIKYMVYNAGTVLLRFIKNIIK